MLNVRNNIKEDLSTSQKLRNRVTQGHKVDLNELKEVTSPETQEFNNQEKKAKSLIINEQVIITEHSPAAF